MNLREKTSNLTARPTRPGGFLRQAAVGDFAWGLGIMPQPASAVDLGPEAEQAALLK
jgi:hypothetical protein